MIRIKEYIIEKLNLNNVNKLEYSLDKEELTNIIISIIKPRTDIEDIREILLEWTEEIDKRIYCYLDATDFKYRKQQGLPENDKRIYVSSITNEILLTSLKAFSKKKDYKIIYHNKENNVGELATTKNSLIISFTDGWFPIIFEKI